MLILFFLKISWIVLWIESEEYKYDRNNVVLRDCIWIFFICIITLIFLPPRFKHNIVFKIFKNQYPLSFILKYLYSQYTGNKHLFECIVKYYQSFKLEMADR